ncbi:MAG: dTMP kinase [bacterium]
MHKLPGTFITFEGIDGSGKTTHIALLAKYLKKKGKKVFVTREPGGKDIAIAEAIRTLILDPKYSVNPRAELLLYEASRAQHVAERIIPLLREEYWVLCDRFTDATLAYQGGGRGIPFAELNYLNRFATNNLEPELTILLDMPVKKALLKARGRTRQNGDRLENEHITFHARVQKSYRYLAQKYKRICRIEVNHNIDETYAKIINIIEKKWPHLKKI